MYICVLILLHDVSSCYCIRALILLRMCWHTITMCHHTTVYVSSYYCIRAGECSKHRRCGSLHASYTPLTRLAAEEAVQVAYCLLTTLQARASYVLKQALTTMLYIHIHVYIHIWSCRRSSSALAGLKRPQRYTATFSRPRCSRCRTQAIQVMRTMNRRLFTSGTHAPCAPSFWVGWYKSTKTDAAAGTKVQIMTQRSPRCPGVGADGKPDLLVDADTGEVMWERARVLLHMRPHTTTYVSSYCFSCVLMLIRAK